MKTVDESTGSVQVCMSIVDGNLAYYKAVTVTLQSMDGTASGITQRMLLDRSILIN